MKSETAMESVEQKLPVAWKPRKQEWWIFGCLALLAFVISLDTTIITPALPVRL